MTCGKLSLVALAGAAALSLSIYVLYKVEWWHSKQHKEHSVLSSSAELGIEDALRIAVKELLVQGLFPKGDYGIDR